VTSRHRRPTLIAALLIVVAGCGGQTGGSPAPTGAASALATGPAATGGPGEPTGTRASAGPTAGASLAPTTTPAATPAATAALAHGFHYGDILKIQVNRLAARIAPKRTAALVHGYDLSEPAPIDGGSVRLNKGDYVSVQLGPVPIGDTTWYLVWPATATTLHPGGLEWYTSPPPDSSPVPAWVAASVGSDAYVSLQKRPSTAELESFMPIGLNVAGVGNYVSAPQARHDGFLIDWAAAAPTSGTSCAFKLALAPADSDFTPVVAVSTTTTTVKLSSLNGFGYTTDWLPIPPGSWETYTVTVTSTCNWAFRFIRLEHD
jgi:hypothetical protein